MCGQCGLILGQKRRTRKELETLSSIFTNLLLLNEARGRDATGIYMGNKDGSGQILKDAVPANFFVKSARFRELMSSFDNSISVFVGHTRWRTVGTPTVSFNNHPIEADFFVGTHNGTILNHKELFFRYNWKRSGQVDSEAIFRMVDVSLGNNKLLNMESFTGGLREFVGTMSFVMRNKYDPDSFYSGIGNMPLHFLHHKKFRCYCYSSDLAMLIHATGNMPDWRIVELPKHQFYQFDVPTLTLKKYMPMIFCSSRAYQSLA